MKIPDTLNLETASFSFLRLEAGGIFIALKPSLQCHQTFVKVGFHDKVTGV